MTPHWRTPMSDGVTHFADDATLKRLRELEAEIQALELNRVMDRQQIDVLKDDAASQQDRFLRCVKTRKDLADKCDKLEAENAELRKRQWQWVNAELSAKLTRAVEFLRRYLNDKFYADVAEFLSEMEDTHE
jgi:septal ring factor EnvC (AmiA/AmiB activator)